MVIWPVWHIDAAIEQKKVLAFVVPFRPAKLSLLLIPAKCSCSLHHWILGLDAAHVLTNLAKEFLRLALCSNHGECSNPEQVRG